MKKIIFFLVCFPITIAKGQSFLQLLTIPDSLKKNASVIKQYENIVFEVTDVDRATLEVQQVFTVMSEEGKNALLFNEYSTKYVSLDEAEIKVYDLAGKVVNKYKKKDMNTVAAGEGLIDDGFVTYFRVPVSSYPVTVEYTYKQRYKGTLFYPSYDIHTSGTSVVNSTFIAKVPKDLDLRYKEMNIKLKPAVKEDGRAKIYEWSVRNIPPVEYEEGASNNRYPKILLAPNKFSFYGYEGDLTTWKNFGIWLNTLYNGQDALPADRQQFFKDLVKNAATDREKARIIYDYLQKNFRYVSIQLGIGGFKPFSADFTDKKKYGDCKGLSNYMKAALNAVGVKSYVAAINANYNGEPVDPGFPSQSFNHVILCVPQAKDSIWLECTSSTTDFATLGSFTENRNALLITESGGVLVPTPRSRCSDNSFVTRSTVMLQEDGSGSTVTAFSSVGEYREIMQDILKDKDDDKKEFLVHYLGFKQPDEFAFKDKGIVGAHHVDLEMRIEKIPEFKAGSKMFINPRLYKIYPGNLPKAQNRRLDYYFRYPFEIKDTTIFKMPEGYVPDALPSVKDSKCEYASYSTKYWFDEKERAIYCTATLVLQQNKIPAAKYASVKAFFDEVIMDNNQKLVIKKN